MAHDDMKRKQIEQAREAAQAAERAEAARVQAEGARAALAAQLAEKIRLDGLARKTSQNWIDRNKATVTPPLTAQERETRRLNAQQQDIKKAADAATAAGSAGRAGVDEKVVAAEAREDFDLAGEIEEIEEALKTGAMTPDTYEAKREALERLGEEQQRKRSFLRQQQVQQAKAKAEDVHAQQVKAAVSAAAVKDSYQTTLRELGERLGALLIRLAASVHFLLCFFVSLLAAFCSRLKTAFAESGGPV